MEDKYILGPDGELYHWGIRGMKWGVRRFQRKDGSLTKAGLKRYADENERLKAKEKVIKRQERNKAKIDKLNAKKAELEAREEALKHPAKPKPASTENNKPAAKKSIKDMTDDELRDHINRMNLEKTYLDAQKSLAASAPPEKVSLGKRFLQSALNDAIIPAAKNAGREWIEKTLKDKLGLNETDPLKKLENEYKQLDWKKKINELKDESEKRESRKEKKERLAYEKEMADLRESEAKLKLQKSIAESERDAAKAKQAIDKLNNKDDTDDGDTPYEERKKKEEYRKSVADYESGLEDMQRYRKKLEAVYGNGDSARVKIESEMKKYAKKNNIDYGDDEDDD